jgi:predicted phage terminase large subunit-like protein
MFKRHWWGRFGAFDRSAAELIVQVWDTAFKEKTTADYSVCSTWATTPTGIYILDVFRERLEFPELKRKAKDQFEKWRPNAVLVEDKASGQSLIQELQRDTLLPVIAVAVDRDKIARAAAVTPYVEAGKVMLPESALWVDDWIEEHAAFPAGAYDDQVDTTSMVLKYLSPDLDTPIVTPGMIAGSILAGRRR